MADERFLLTAKGDGFEFTQQGSGDMEKAIAAFAAQYPDLEVTGSSFGEPVDMSGR